MSKKYTTKAIILQGRNYGEADKIMIAFTKEKGRVDFFARGVRKIKSKNRALLQPFTYSELEFVEGKGLDILTQGVLIDSFSAIRQNFDHIIECSFMAEYLIQVLEPHDPYVALCYQFLWALNYLDKRKPLTNVVTLSFLIKSFELLGYGPYISGCGLCDKTWSEMKQPHFMVSEGMVMCQSCRSKSGFNMDVHLARFYYRLSQADYKKDLSFLEQEQWLPKISVLVEQMMMHILEREHKSTSFLRKIKGLHIS